MKSITITARVHKDPVLHAATANTKERVSFQACVNNGKDNNGNWKQSDWFTVNCYDNLAISVLDRVKDGDKVLVIGIPSFWAYVNQSGVAVPGLTIKANTIETFTSNKSESDLPSKQDQEDAPY